MTRSLPPFGDGYPGPGPVICPQFPYQVLEVLTSHDIIGLQGKAERKGGSYQFLCSPLSRQAYTKEGGLGGWSRAKGGQRDLLSFRFGLFDYLKSRR